MPPKSGSVVPCHISENLFPHTENNVHTRSTVTMLLVIALAACGDETTNPATRSAQSAAARAAKSSGPTDPTATWKFPLNDASLAIRSDRLYSDGTSSVYANGVCNVSTTIFATTEKSNSGDATLSTGNPSAKCTRRVHIVFPDGSSESLPMFSNLRAIENTTYLIPIGTTVLRQLHIGISWPNVVSRCDGLVWGYGVANDIAAGSDSVWVARVDASTWHVFSQDAPHNIALCKATGELLPMPVDFTVVSSRPLP